MMIVIIQLNEQCNNFILIMHLSNTVMLEKQIERTTTEQGFTPAAITVAEKQSLNLVLP